MGSEGLILHVDADAFFASVEQRQKPTPPAPPIFSTCSTSSEEEHEATTNPTVGPDYDPNHETLTDTQSQHVPRGPRSSRALPRLLSQA